MIIFKGRKNIGVAIIAGKKCGPAAPIGGHVAVGFEGIDAVIVWVDPVDAFIAALNLSPGYGTRAQEGLVLQSRAGHWVRLRLTHVQERSYLL